MCQKSALQCQLTCLYVLYTVNPCPSPLAAIHIVYKIYQVLGKLSILNNYFIQLQKRHSGAVDQSRAVDLHFRALHNILLTMERRHRFGDAPSPHCPRCPTLVEDSLNFFTSCPRVAGAWDNILHRAILLSGLALTNRSLFYLAWSARPARMEARLTLAVITFSAWGDKGPRGPPPTSRLSSQNCPGCGWQPAPFLLLIFFNPDPDFGSGLPKQWSLELTK